LIALPLDLQLAHGRTLDFGSRRMTFDVDGFSFHPPVHAVAVDSDAKTPEQQLARRHFVDHRVEPVDQQQFPVRRLASDFHDQSGFDRVGVRDRRRQGRDTRS